MKNRVWILCSLTAILQLSTPHPLWAQSSETAETTKDGAASAEPYTKENFFWGDGNITSVSKRKQTIDEVPNSVSVVTRDDIVASGATTIPELFAFLPGVQLFYRNGNEPEIAIRGLPKQYSSKILVLVDGVSVYSPFTSGIFWYSLPVTIDSIERVEVIRGPSSVLYGANAFFGVINIITRTSENFTGVEARAYAGNLGNYGASATTLYPAGSKGHFRFSGEYFQSNGFGANNGDDIDDSAKTGTVMADGFIDINDRSKLRLGTWYRRTNNELPTNNVLPAAKIVNDTIFSVAQFESNLGGGHQFNVQTFYTSRLSDTPGQATALNKNRTQEFDIQVEDLWNFRDKNYLTLGANYRFNWLTDTTLIAPSFFDKQELHMASLYLNDEFKVRDNVILTGGARYDYDTFTKNNFSGRFNISWLPHPNHLLRASVARGFRNMNFFEELGDAQFPFGPAQVTFKGDPTLPPEYVTSTEFGYIGNFLDRRLRFNFDFFYNVQDNIVLLTIEPLAPTELKLAPKNLGDVNLVGFEYGLKYRIFDWWDFTFDHSVLHQSNGVGGQGPSNMINVGQRFKTKVGFSANLAFNWTDSYAVYDLTAGRPRPIGQLFRLDARLAQKFLKDRLEFSVVTQGIFDYPRIEYEPTLRTDRRIYGMLTFRQK